MTDKECLNSIQEIVDEYMQDEEADGFDAMDAIIKVMFLRDRPYEDTESDI